LLGNSITEGDDGDAFDGDSCCLARMICRPLATLLSSNCIPSSSKSKVGGGLRLTFLLMMPSCGDVVSGGRLVCDRSRLFVMSSRRSRSASTIDVCPSEAAKCSGVLPF
jgi:hypothetical protein